MTDTGIVRINASLDVTAAAAEDYSTTLIVDCNHTSLDRAAVYTHPDDYATAVPVGTPLRAALDSAFSASVRPAQVIAGRSKGKAVLTPLNVADTEQYDVTISVSSGDTVLASYTAVGGDEAEEVCIALKADIDAVTEVVAEVTATVVGTGVDAVLEVVFNGADDDFTVSGLSDNMEFTSVATEAPADSLAAISDFNSAWTWITTTDHNPSYQLTMMSQAEVLQKPYVASTQLSEAYASWNGEDTPDANDVGANAVFNNYSYTHVMYHHQADAKQTENVRLTQFTRYLPGTSNFQYEALAGVPLAQRAEGDRALNSTELFNLETKSMSTIAQLGGQAVVANRPQRTANRMANGVRMEAMAVLIRTRQEVARILETLLLNKPKLSMTDPSDHALIKGSIEKFFIDNASGGGVTRAFRGDRPVDVIMPDPKSISFEDQADGIFQNIRVIGYLDPSIDSVILDLSLTYLNPVEA